MGSFYTSNTITMKDRKRFEEGDKVDAALKQASSIEDRLAICLEHNLRGLNEGWLFPHSDKGPLCPYQITLLDNKCNSKVMVLDSDIVNIRLCTGSIDPKDVPFLFSILRGETCYVLSEEDIETLKSTISESFRES